MRGRSALAEGADGYLLKRATATELVDAVRTVDAGGAALAPSITTTVVGWLREGRAEQPPPPIDLDLTAREREVLHLIGAGFTNPEIASHLFLSTSTVKKHVTAVLAKTGARDRVNAALLAQRLDPPRRSPQ